MDPEDESDIIEELIRTVAVVVGIETYQYSKPPHAMQGVAFAKADAQEIAEALSSQFAVSDDDLHLWINEDATKTRFENDLSVLGCDNGATMIKDSSYSIMQDMDFTRTAQIGSLSGIAIQQVWQTLLFVFVTCCYRSFRSPDVSQILLFIDACAVPLDESLRGRDIIGALSNREFEEFIASNEYNAQFMSCSPGEKSYPELDLKHGIWTWHLLQALGKEWLLRLCIGESGSPISPCVTTFETKWKSSSAKRRRSTTCRDHMHFFRLHTRSRFSVLLRKNQHL